MPWIEETLDYMLYLFRSSFDRELDLQERFIRGTSFLLLSILYSFIGALGAMFLGYGALMAWGVFNG
jgi:hypothetical protein